MSIYVKAVSPHYLLSAIQKKVSENAVNNWEVDSDGDFTHKSELWRYKAWFHPIVKGDMVVFAILGRKSNNLSVEEYATYHGMFISMLLRHFDQMMTNIEVTPLGSMFDSIDAEKVHNDKSE